MLNANYHTHTYRCGHAVGKEEEYILEALSMGLAEIGISDHAMYPDYDEPGLRGSFSLNAEYFRSVRALQQKYKDRIKVLLGYEAEYFQPYITYLKELLMTGGIDYLLLGNHSSMNERHQVYARYGRSPTANNIYLYCETACQAMRTGLYSCFVHPDLFLAEVPYFDLDCRRVSRELIRTAMECQIPLEINCGGIRSGKKRIGDNYRWCYPTYSFFQMASRMGAECIIGIDAHAPKQLSDPLANAEAVRFARELGLQVIDRLKLKKIENHQEVKHG